jgi:hypothetical protein
MYGIYSKQQNNFCVCCFLAPVNLPALLEDQQRRIQHHAGSVDENINFFQHFQCHAGNVNVNDSSMTLEVYENFCRLHRSSTALILQLC